MNPYGWSIFYGLAAMATLWLSYSTPLTVQCVREASWLLAGRFLTDNLTYYLMHDHHWAFYVILDSICAVICFSEGLRRSYGWLVALGCIFAVCVIRHAAFFTAHDLSYSARYNYDLSLNLFYLCQLGLVVLVSVSGFKKARQA